MVISYLWVIYSFLFRILEMLWPCVNTSFGCTKSIEKPSLVSQPTKCMLSYQHAPFSLEECLKDDMKIRASVIFPTKSGPEFWWL
ncbi:hypothetical protein IW261DRAFT_1431858 [Armillaria novae-zelandiae]|uniref:Secreted protein n=1 Tax=Armillaria novae-zelandiae TaxID=153914 RepID=A0AA39PUI7_9AGAR|nr:hypothetical protein IW261DRAFT_1431858 [Armillaria novae-zelandiae]